MPYAFAKICSEFRIELIRRGAETAQATPTILFLSYESDERRLA